ncbi:hypothetical protein KPH14_000911 [Odynerus spinipes]|uniref:FP protein C-terminal domain-containing protein n=1 Tax=Odynerus spinipes TaxID=1348599 RepID=A0AAD9RG55_9HYME|nr:hypothetical protein KPH14_000911 [Odynerus spinipes]
MATQLARQFLMASTRICSTCYKAIATEAVYCSGCASYFHPGCVKKRIQQTDTARCCSGIALEFLAQGAEPLTAFSSATSSASGSCSPTGQNSRASLSACPPSQPTSGSRDPISNADLLRLLSVRLDDIALRISGLPAMKEHIDMNTARIANLEEQNRLLREGVSDLKHLYEVEQRERELGWLTVSDRRLFLALSTIYTIKQSRRPSYLNDLLVPRDVDLYLPARIDRGVGPAAILPPVAEKPTTIGGQIPWDWLLLPHLLLSTNPTPRRGHVEPYSHTAGRGTLALKCTSCKKEVVTDASRCSAWKGYFHPGCFKPHKVLGQKGERITCTGFAQAVKRPIPSARATSPTLLAPSPPLTATTPSDAETTEASQLSVLAAVQACSDSVSAFRDDQLRHNRDSDIRLANLRKDIVGRMDRLAADLKAVSTRVTGVEARVDSLGTDLKDLSRKQGELSTSMTARLDKNEECHRSYAEALRSTEAATSKLASKVAALTDKVTRLEGDRRASQLVLSGLPEKPGEDLRTIVTKASSVLGVDLPSTHLVRVTRMRGVPNVDRPRLVHILLASSISRDAIISAKRKKGQLLASEVDATLGTRQIFVNEYLSRDTWALLRQARVVARKRGYQHVWIRSGRVYVRRESGSSITSISSTEDLNNLS